MNPFVPVLYLYGTESVMAKMVIFAKGRVLAVLPPFSQYLAGHTSYLSLCLCLSPFARTNPFRS